MSDKPIDKEILRRFGEHLKEAVEGYKNCRNSLEDAQVTPDLAPDKLEYAKLQYSNNGLYLADLAYDHSTVIQWLLDRSGAYDELAAAVRAGHWNEAARLAKEG